MATNITLTVLIVSIFVSILVQADAVTTSKHSEQTSTSSPGTISSFQTSSPPPPPQEMFTTTSFIQSTKMNPVSVYTTTYSEKTTIWSTNTDQWSQTTPAPARLKRTTLLATPSSQKSTKTTTNTNITLLSTIEPSSNTITQKLSPPIRSISAPPTPSFTTSTSTLTTSTTTTKTPPKTAPSTSTKPTSSPTKPPTAAPSTSIPTTSTLITKPPVPTTASAQTTHLIPPKSPPPTTLTVQPSKTVIPKTTHPTAAPITPSTPMSSQAQNPSQTPLRAGVSSTLEKTTTASVARKGPFPDPKSGLPVIVQEAAKWIPELGQIIAGSSTPNATQLESIYLFIQGLKNLVSTPESVLVLIADLEKSGLFDVLSTTPAFNTTQVPTTTNPFSSSWTSCQQDINSTLESLDTGELWALRMLDASGKPGHSILEGNSRFLGNHKECTRATSPQNGNQSRIEGTICRVSFTILMSLPESPLPNTSISWDVCVPKTCMASDLKLFAKKSLDSVRGISHIDVTCASKLELYEDPGAIVAICVLLILGLFALGGTLLDAILVVGYEEEDSYVINGYATNNDVKTFANQGFEFNETSLTENDQERHRRPDTTPANLDEKDLHRERNGRSRSTHGTVGRPVMGLRDLTNDGSKFNSMYMPGESGMGKSIDKESWGEFSPGGEDDDEKRKNPRDNASLPLWQRAALAFSVPRNMNKILTVKSSPGGIRCLHGIRVLSLGWVLLGTTFTDTLRSFQNPVAPYRLLSTWRGQIILNGSFAFDTFFLLSGLLTTYKFLKECGSRHQVPTSTGIMYYLRRFWRLTPPYMLWLMIVATLLKHVGEESQGLSDTISAQACRDKWWTNLLYVNNLYVTDGDRCLPKTWYLANDMQFHIVAPLALVPWVLGARVVGFLVVGLMIALHLTANIWLQIDLDGAGLLRNKDNYFTDVYIQPYARVAPYAIGLITGWALWRCKCRMEVNKYAAIIGWILSFAIVFTLTFVTFDENKDLTTDPWTVAGKTTFESLSRPLWSMSVGWIAFTCATGNGGVINALLGWKGWLPLSRLTYCVFLVHYTIINFEQSFTDSSMFFSETIMVYRFFGFFLMSCLVGLLLSLVVESPMIAIEKLWSPRKDN